MCVVSNISDWGRDNYPDWARPLIPTTPLPQILPYDPVKKHAEDEARKMREFLELVEKAKKFDKTAGQPNCEDPKKAEFITNVERRLAAIEKALAALKPKKKKRTAKRARK